MLLIFILLGLPVLLYFYYEYKVGFYRKLGLRGRWPIPFLGDIPYYFFPKLTPVFKYDYNNVQRYGREGFYDHTVFGRTAICIADPEMAKLVLIKDFNNFVERVTVTFLPDHLRKALVFISPEDWKRVRSIDSTTFSSGKIKRIYQGFKKPMQQFVNNLNEELDKNPNKSIQIKDFSKFFAVDVVAKLVFASEIDSYKNQHNDFLANLNRLVRQNPAGIALANALPVWLFRLLKINIFNIQAKDYFVNQVNHLIEERKKHPEVRYDDFLQLLLEAEEESDQDDQNEVDPKARTLNREEIIGQCLVFFFAGMETISSAISNFLYDMAMHPEIQEQLYEELTKLYPENEISYDRLNESKLLLNCLKETLRMKPSLARLFRTSKQAYQFPNGLKIPANQLVFVPAYYMHHDPEKFIEPFKYRPERFDNELDGEDNWLLAFGDGPRHCIGMRFALVEVKYFLINFLRKYRVFKAPDTDVPPNYVNFVIIMTYNKLNLGIERR